MKISSTETIIGALHALAHDMQTDDCVISAFLSEAADRMEELKSIADTMSALRKNEMEKRAK